MGRYDILFVGHVAAGNIVPYEGTPFILEGSAVLFSTMAAFCVGKKVAVITRLARGEERLLYPFKAVGIDVYMQIAPATTWMDVIYPSANVDERQAVLLKNAGFFEIEEIPPPRTMFNPPRGSDRPGVYPRIYAEAERARIPSVARYAKFCPAGR